VLKECLVFSSIRLGVPFIAPRQLGAVESNPGKQFLPSVAWRTGQSGAPLDTVRCGSLSLFGEADRWRLGAVGAPDTVRCTPDSPVPPSSVGQLYDLGLQCLFTPTEVIVSKMDDESMVFKGFRYNNLYLVDFTSEDADLRTCLFTKASLGWLWHRRLAHVGMSTLKKVLKKDMVRGLKDVVFEKDKPCSACQAGKQVAKTHPTKDFMSTSRPLELLHMDLFGPTNYVSAGGNLYCLVIVDDFSRYTWVFFIHDKYEVASIFKKFAKKAQNEFDCKIKKIRSDNGK
jgi:hypothetical protein